MQQLTLAKTVSTKNT